jgi:pyridoxamine 5'-phosphate oxidase
MQASLNEADVAAEPLQQFEAWFTQAQNAGMTEPNAMTVATIGADGRPQARIVLLKGLDARGYTFYTHYESRKGQAIAVHDEAAILFYWPELERQVRIEGRISKIAADESDAYYTTRPLGSRIGAWASPQSATLASRDWLEQEWQTYAAKLGDNPTRPPHWGGYRLSPVYYEFWQGRRSRLHDRVVYTLVDGAWAISRLAP